MDLKNKKEAVDLIQELETLETELKNLSITNVQSVHFRTKENQNLSISVLDTEVKPIVYFTMGLFTSRIQELKEKIKSL